MTDIESELIKIEIEIKKSQIKANEVKKKHRTFQKLARGGASLFYLCVWFYGTYSPAAVQADIFQQLLLIQLLLAMLLAYRVTEFDK